MTYSDTDYYQLLEIARDATQEEIKRAYRKLAFRYHPDVNSDREAGELFKHISRAYAVLADPVKRQYYDRYGTGLLGERERHTAAAAKRPFGRCMGRGRGIGRGCGKMWMWEELLRKR